MALAVDNAHYHNEFRRRFVDIYDVIDEHRDSPILAERIAAAILHNLNDRRGIKNELRQIDEDVIEEMFRSHVRIISDLLLPTTPDNAEPLPFEVIP